VELKSLLQESRFAGWDLRLVDEECRGTLTEQAENQQLYCRWKKAASIALA